MLSQRSEEGSSKGACEREPGERGGGEITSGLGRNSVAWTGSVLLRGGCQNVSEMKETVGGKGAAEEKGGWGVKTYSLLSLSLCTTSSRCRISPIAPVQRSSNSASLMPRRRLRETLSFSTTSSTSGVEAAC